MPCRLKVRGSGRGIREFGGRRHFLHQGWPWIFDRQFIFDIWNSMLGTSLIRPYLPEMNVWWSFFWQQTESVAGGGTKFMFWYRPQISS